MSRFFYSLSSYSIVLVMLASRVLFAALALSLLAAILLPARRKLAPMTRSALWAFCVPALFLPFEHSAILLAQSLGVAPLAPESGLVGVLQLALSILWLAGCILSLIRTALQNRRTVRLIRSRAFPSCAAYFYRGRSRVYLPEGFDDDYTAGERSALLAHERQHIAQHDPLLFRGLQLLLCVFWFCPPIHHAVGRIRHDRELLCDERAIRGRSKREYGLLLLREARRFSPGHAIAGIASDADGLAERVRACAVPFPGGRKAAALAICAAMAVSFLGAVGAATPIMEKPMEVRIFLAGDESYAPIAGTERFVSFREDGILVDGAGLSQYLSSAGIAAKDGLHVSVTERLRPSLTTYSTVLGGASFRPEELRAGEQRIPYYDAQFSLWNALYQLL